MLLLLLLLLTSVGRRQSPVGLIEFVSAQIDYFNFVVRELTKQDLLNLFVATIAQIHSIPFDNLISYMKRRRWQQQRYRLVVARRYSFVH